MGEREHEERVSTDPVVLREPSTEVHRLSDVEDAPEVVDEVHAALGRNVHLTTLPERDRPVERREGRCRQDWRRVLSGHCTSCAVEHGGCLASAVACLTKQYASSGGSQ